MIRVLAVANFDPAGVLVGHRKALRAAGIDYRLALHCSVRDGEREGADWCHTTTSREAAPWGNPDALVDFAQNCQILQFHPGIVPNYADVGDEPKWQWEPLQALNFGINWQRICAENAAAAKVAYFHGSVQTWVNREAYAARYRAQNFVLAASTLDYAAELDAVYLPPAIDVDGFAPTWQGHWPFKIAHCPSNPSVCHTAEITAAALEFSALELDLAICTKRTHAESIATKAASHAVFDHLRGSFSVNALEGAALGAIPIFRLLPRYAERLNGAGISPVPWPTVPYATKDALVATIRELMNFPEKTAALQIGAQAWCDHFFSPTAIAARLAEFYERLVKEQRRY